MTKVLVSVIIPVYQVSDYIERCLSSVIRQTYQHIECIIVNDATEDDSMEKCERMIASYSGPIRFRVVHHESNKGLSAARNTGMRNASGDYLYFLDSDDEITPNCIESFVKTAEEFPNAEMIVGNYQTFPEHEQRSLRLDKGLPSSMETNEAIAAAFLAHRFPMNAWNKLTKSSFLLDNNLFFKDGILYEDIHWTFFVIKYLQHIRINKAVTYHYYIRPGSIVTDAKEDAVGKSFYQIYDDIIHHLTKGRESQELSSYVEGFCNRYLRHRGNIPEYNTLYLEYRRKVKEFGSKNASLKLRLAFLMGKMPFGLKVLESLRNLKSSMKAK